MQRYKKFKGKIDSESISGLKMKVDCTNPASMFVESMQYAFNEHGEEAVRQLFEKELTRLIQFKKNWEAEQVKRK